MNAASQRTQLSEYANFSPRQIKTHHLPTLLCKISFVAEKKRLVVFLTASGELLGSPSVSKPLEKSWTYSLRRRTTHKIPKSLTSSPRRKISPYCMQASDVIGLYPHTSPITRGSALSTSDATHALRDISRALSDIAAIAPHRFRIRNLLCSP